MIVVTQTFSKGKSTKTYHFDCTAALRPRVILITLETYSEWDRTGYTSKTIWQAGDSYTQEFPPPRVTKAIWAEATEKLIAKLTCGGGG